MWNCVRACLERSLPFGLAVGAVLGVLAAIIAASGGLVIVVFGVGLGTISSAIIAGLLVFGLVVGIVAAACFIGCALPVRESRSQDESVARAATEDKRPDIPRAMAARPALLIGGGAAFLLIFVSWIAGGVSAWHEAEAGSPTPIEAGSSDPCGDLREERSAASQTALSLQSAKEACDFAALALFGAVLAFAAGALLVALLAIGATGTDAGFLAIWAVMLGLAGVGAYMAWQQKVSKCNELKQEMSAAFSEVDTLNLALDACEAANPR